MLWTTNALVYALNAPVVATGRVRFREPLAPLLASLAAGRPLIFATWHRFNYACIPALCVLPAALRPTLVMHDGLASRALTHRSSAWIGLDTFVYARRGERPPRAQIIDYVRASGRPILNLPDSGGPYGVVKPGIVEVAGACDALLVPFVVRARPALVIGASLRHVIPLPFAEIELARAAPIEGRSASVPSLQRALDELAFRPGGAP